MKEHIETVRRCVMRAQGFGPDLDGEDLSALLVAAEALADAHESARDHAEIAHDDYTQHLRENIREAWIDGRRKDAVEWLGLDVPIGVLVEILDDGIEDLDRPSLVLAESVERARVVDQIRDEVTDLLATRPDVGDRIQADLLKILDGVR